MRILIIRRVGETWRPLDVYWTDGDIDPWVARRNRSTPAGGILWSSHFSVQWTRAEDLLPAAMCQFLQGGLRQSNTSNFRWQIFCEIMHEDQSLSYASYSRDHVITVLHANRYIILYYIYIYTYPLVKQMHSRSRVVSCSHDDIIWIMNEIYVAN